MATKRSGTPTVETTEVPGSQRRGAPSPPVLKPTPGRRLQPTIAEYYLGSGVKRVPRAPGRDASVLTALRTMRDYDSDGSAATWSTLRLGNTGHTVEVKDDSDKPMPEAEARLNVLAERVWKDGGGGADILAGTLFMTLYTEGGAGLETVLTPDLADIYDIYPLVPADIEFGYVIDPVTGLLDLAIFPARKVFSRDDDIPCNPLQTKYLPVDPAVNDPYGRPPMLPAVSALIKLLDLINEHIMVTRIHGFGMRYVRVVLDNLAKLYPDLLNPGREDDLKSYIESAVAQAQETISSLDPTETPVFPDYLEMNTLAPGGRGAGQEVQPMMAEQRRRVWTGLKKMPILLGETESTGTQSTVQWQVEVKGITTFQDMVKRLMEAAYNTCLRVWGIAGKATITFNTIRDTDRMIDAQANRLEYELELSKYKDGITDHATLADRTDGHEPMGPPPPTTREEFEQDVASSAAAPLPPVDEEEDVPDANQPGTDSGISEEEGEALDQAGQNMARSGGTIRDLVRSLYDLGYDARFFIPPSHLRRAGRAYYREAAAIGRELESVR